MIFEKSHLEDPMYGAALNLLGNELEIAYANQRIDNDSLKEYKKTVKKVIYNTPKQNLADATKSIYDSIQKNLLGMEPLMGLPQRYFAPAIYNGIAQEVSRFHGFSSDKAYQYLQDIDLTEQSVANWMRKGGFKKEDIPDKRTWEMLASVADKDFIDPFLNLPYPFYVQGEKEPKWKKRLKKIGAIASTALMVGVPMASLGYLVEKFPGKIFHPFNDSDLGGIPNKWEDAHGLDKWNPRDDREDSNGNGYTNLQEYLLGLDPKNPDCDHDGLLDGGDPDHDNITTWVEVNIFHTDPLTPNDRYVLLISPVHFYMGEATGIVSWLVKGEMDKQYNFFHDKMKIPKQNIIDLRYPNATYKNFVKAVNKISNISDENDFVYVVLNGHGARNEFFFDEGNDWKSWMQYNELIKILDRIPSKEQYLEIGSCHSGSAIESIKSLESKNSFSGPPTQLYPGVTHNPDNQSMCNLNSEKINDTIRDLSSRNHILRVVVTSSSSDGLTYWFPLIDSIYPSVLGNAHTLYVGNLPFPLKTKPDKNHNHFVSVKEAFQDLVYSRESLNGHPILKRITRKQHPQIYDPDNISDELYFGEYAIKD